MDTNYPQHKESFEVVLIKRNISSLTAKPGDFKRIPVVATDPLAAQMSDEVIKEKEWLPLFAAPPGVLTDPEIQARQRELSAEVDVVDRSKI